jgi:tRNA pseudouridine13 synthase
MTRYLTDNLPGAGGTIREQPEDFFVEEIPLYSPCGEGDHLYLHVEKRGLTTYDLMRELSSALDCKERDLGYAGLKDAQAVTRQTISVPLRKPDDVKGLDIPGVKLLSAELHTNKLRVGHLAGNHFRIRINQPASEGMERAESILGVLQDLGVPNRFGSQRYGILGNSHLIGRAILQGAYQTAIEAIIGDPQQITHQGWKRAAEAFQNDDLESAINNLPRHCRPERKLLQMLKDGKSARKAVMAMPRKLLRLYLSAYQSSLFDRLVDMRLDTMEHLWKGDLAYKHVNGASFLVTDPELEQPRADAFEISPTAPLFGHKTKLAEGQSGILERSLLESEKLSLESFKLPGGLAMAGERRPVRVPIHGCNCTQAEDGITVSFSLPKGSFATSVLAEIMKCDAVK